MNRSLLLAACLTTVFAFPSLAQHVDPQPMEPTAPRVLGLPADQGQAERQDLREAFEKLAATLVTLSGRIAEDPELRLSLAHAGVEFANAAELLVTEQSQALRDVLRSAADQIEAFGRRRAENALTP